MNNKSWIVAVAAIGSMFLLAQVGGRALAQEDTYELGNKEVFGKLQRPPVTFPHEVHMNTMECGDCHHEYDEAEGKLVPVDDPDRVCADCHGLKGEGNQPGLRQAFHLECIGCHRTLLKKREATGPVTCGECHKR